MLRFHLIAAAILAATALATTGCGPRGKSDETVRVAFVTNNPYEFWTIARRGTEKAAKEFNVEVDFRSPPTGTADEQRAIVEDLLTKGVKAIAISPNDAANQAEFLDEVADKVPLITQDSDLPPGSKRICYIGTDNYEAGRAAGQLVKETMPDGGNVVIFVGKLDVQNAIERRQGVLDELAGSKSSKGPKLGQYTLIDTLTDDAKQEKCKAHAEDVLAKHGSQPEKLCLVGLWAYNPPAMLSAVKDAHLEGKVHLVAFDENEETLQGVKDGYIYGTIVQQPFQFGYEAVKIMSRVARGDNSILPETGVKFLDHKVITRDNVDDFWTELKRLKQ